MCEFFKPWRRKLGAVTLVVACVNLWEFLQFRPGSFATPPEFFLFWITISVWLLLSKPRPKPKSRGEIIVVPESPHESTPGKPVNNNKLFMNFVFVLVGIISLVWALLLLVSMKTGENWKAYLSSAAGWVGGMTLVYMLHVRKWE